MTLSLESCWTTFTQEILESGIIGSMISQNLKSIVVDNSDKRINAYKKFSAEIKACNKIHDKEIIIDQQQLVMTALAIDIINCFNTVPTNTNSKLFEDAATALSAMSSLIDSQLASFLAPQTIGKICRLLSGICNSCKDPNIVIKALISIRNTEKLISSLILHTESELTSHKVEDQTLDLLGWPTLVYWFPWVFSNGPERLPIYDDKCEPQHLNYDSFKMDYLQHSKISKTTENEPRTSQWKTHPSNQLISIISSLSFLILKESNSKKIRGQALASLVYLLTRFEKKILLTISSIWVTSLFKSSIDYQLVGVGGQEQICAVLKSYSTELGNWFPSLQTSLSVCAALTLSNNSSPSELIVRLEKSIKSEELAELSHSNSVWSSLVIWLGSSILTNQAINTLLNIIKPLFSHQSKVVRKTAFESWGFLLIALSKLDKGIADQRTIDLIQKPIYRSFKYESDHEVLQSAFLIYKHFISIGHLQVRTQIDTFLIVPFNSLSQNSASFQPILPISPNTHNNTPLQEYLNKYAPIIARFSMLIFSILKEQHPNYIYQVQSSKWNIDKTRLSAIDNTATLLFNIKPFELNKMQGDINPKSNSSGYLNSTFLLLVLNQLVTTITLNNTDKNLLEILNFYLDPIQLQLKEILDVPSAQEKINTIVPIIFSIIFTRIHPLKNKFSSQIDGVKETDSNDQKLISELTNTILKPWLSKVVPIDTSYIFYLYLLYQSICPGIEKESIITYRKTTELFLDKANISTSVSIDLGKISPYFCIELAPHNSGSICNISHFEQNGVEHSSSLFSIISSLLNKLKEDEIFLQEFGFIVLVSFWNILRMERYFEQKQTNHILLTLFSKDFENLLDEINNLWPSILKSNNSSELKNYFQVYWVKLLKFCHSIPKVPLISNLASLLYKVYDYFLLHLNVSVVKYAWVNSFAKCYIEDDSDTGLHSLFQKINDSIEFKSEPETPSTSTVTAESTLPISKNKLPRNEYEVEEELSHKPKRIFKSSTEPSVDKNVQNTNGLINSAPSIQIPNVPSNMEVSLASSSEAGIAQAPSNTSRIDSSNTIPIDNSTQPHSETLSITDPKMWISTLKALNDNIRILRDASDEDNTKALKLLSKTLSALTSQR